MAPTDIATTDKALAKQQKKDEKKRLKKLAKKQAQDAIGTASAAVSAPVAGDADASKEAKKKRKERDGAVPAATPVITADESEAKKNKNKKSKKNVDVTVTEAKTSGTKSATATPTAAAAAWLAEHEISIVDEAHHVQWTPFLNFKDVPVSAKLAEVMGKFERPSPIQGACWPIALAKRDVIGIAETGSGKTLGFGIPALHHISQHAPASIKDKRPLGLVLAPTRELAIQIFEQLKEAGASTGIRCLCVYGGVPKDEQRRTLREGVHVVIATPGRLLDLAQEGSLSLDRVQYVVLDEADRMLDMGFEREVRTILSQTSTTGRQTLMFSATWPTSIQKLAHEFLNEPVKVTVGSPDLGANHNIKQIVEVLKDPMDKERRLCQLLNEYHKSRKNKVLVFALYKKEADRLERMLQRQGWNCIAIHGDMSQEKRNTNFELFKSGKSPLLIATDVAARGLDIKDVEYVLNVTFPLTIEDYVHRIGRTGRAGRTGIAHTLFTVQEKGRAGELINVLKDAGQPVPEALLAFGTTVKKKEHSAFGAFYKEIDPSAKATKITFGDSDEE